MKTVYLIRSLSNPTKRYTGITSDFSQRLRDHNAGKSAHTAKYKPWRVVVLINFADDKKAEAFEAYLKSGSGHAFANGHFW